MSSDDENGASPSLMSLSKRTKRGWLVQMPQSHRPEGAPPLQRRARSPVIIHSTPKRVRRKVRSEEDELADLASAFKRQRQSAPATDVAPDAFGSSTEMTPGTETPEQESTPSPTSEHNGPNFDDRESQGSEDNDGAVYTIQRGADDPAIEGYSSESSSGVDEDETRDDDTLSTGNVDVPAMRRANAERNWAQFNVPAGPPMGRGANDDRSREPANHPAPALLPRGTPMHSSRAPHERSTGYSQQAGGDGPEPMGRGANGSDGGCIGATRDVINVYISLEGADGVERPYVEFDVSVSRGSIGEALTRILIQGGRTARVLNQMDHSLFTVSTSTRPLSLSAGGGDDLSFREISTLNEVLSKESSNYNTPLRHCRACPETTMVVEETQLSREDLYVIYIHKTSAGDYERHGPATAGAPTATSAPATAPAPVDEPVWATWDAMFLTTISPMSSLFDETYNEAFKTYAAMTIAMGIAHEINDSGEKKPMTMGRDGRVPEVLAWLKARVGHHKMSVFDRAPKTLGRYWTFWNRVQQLSRELSQCKFGNTEYDRDRSATLDMLIVWQKVPARAGDLEAEPPTADELRYLTRGMSLSSAEKVLKCEDTKKKM
ncbi:uncharacterized protein ARMOST_17143 [Armillaria ostoyae]|uniref:Uncharacterized protein n=1 Tax=Armillaria ostoyae TaxID=47428 RepID=A0A284RY79_ARMOS|nr:uncharacterized protein ARMOST_17143 [Armillaria ostoyae]